MTMEWVCGSVLFFTAGDLEPPSTHEVGVDEDEAPRSSSHLSSLLDSEKDIGKRWNIRDSVDSTWRCVGEGPVRW